MTQARGSQACRNKSHNSSCVKVFGYPSSFQRHQRTHTEDKHHEYKHCWKAFRECSYVQIHGRTHSGKNCMDESKAWMSSILWAALKDMEKLTGEWSTMYLSSGGKPAVFSVHAGGIKTAQCTKRLHMSITEGKLQFYCPPWGNQLWKQNLQWFQLLSFTEQKLPVFVCK